jgi:hypothetical protein
MVRQYSDLRRFLRSRWGIGVLVFLGVGAVLLIFDHRAHIAGNNLVLGGLLLACVVMHFFMHGDHGGHGGPGKGGR